MGIPVDSGNFAKFSTLKNLTNDQQRSRSETIFEIPNRMLEFKPQNSEASIDKIWKAAASISQGECTIQFETHISVDFQYCTTYFKAPPSE